MINLFPENVWLANAILTGIVVATAAVAAFPALRWGWKAWPLMLLAALAVPTMIAVVLTVVLLLIADRIGITGGVAHSATLDLIGISSASLGFAVALAWRWVRPQTR